MTAGTAAWLAEQAGAGSRAPVGIFSSPDLARDACQGIADEYFGPKLTPPLQWRGTDRRAFAAYSHPTSGGFVFVVTMLTIDEVIRP